LRLKTFLFLKIDILSVPSCPLQKMLPLILPLFIFHISTHKFNQTHTHTHTLSLCLSFIICIFLSNILPSTFPHTYTLYPNPISLSLTHPHTHPHTHTKTNSKKLLFLSLSFSFYVVPFDFVSLFHFFKVNVLCPNLLNFLCNFHFLAIRWCVSPR